MTDSCDCPPFKCEPGCDCVYCHLDRAKAEVDRLRAALHAHCPHCCLIQWHRGQGWQVAS